MTMARPVFCAGCNKHIYDKFLMTVLDRSWHVQCLRCCECQGLLSEKCFTREGSMYCRDDFFRLFGTKCNGCGLGVAPEGLVRRARGKVFHLTCFVCSVCQRMMDTGDHMYILGDRFICKEDYTAGKHFETFPDFEESTTTSEEMESARNGSRSAAGMHGPPSAAHFSEPPSSISPATSVEGSLEPLKSLDPPLKPSPVTPNTREEPPLMKASLDAERAGNDSPDDISDKNRDDIDDDGSGGSKRRGPRTTIKAKQLEVLKTAFNTTPKPTRHIREQLAQQTGLTMRVIQVWFQNKRSKERRMKQVQVINHQRRMFRAAGARRLRPDLGEDGPYPFYGDLPPGADYHPFPPGGPPNGFYENPSFYPHPRNGPPGSADLPFPPDGHPHPPTSEVLPLPASCPPPPSDPGFVPPEPKDEGQTSFSRLIASEANLTTVW